MDNARVLNALLMTPGPRGFWGLTPNLIGKPGTAKTSSLEAAARRAGLPFKTIILSMRRPEDQLGLPFIRPEGKGVGFEPPDWVRWCQQVGRALIIFDEINTCEAPTQASCLRIMAERVVGDVELPRGIRFATAMNAVEDAAGGHDMASSFANRVGHWAWDSGGVQPFLIYMLSRGGRAAPEETAADPAKAEAQVMEKWDPFWTSACGIVAGFLQRRPDLLSKPPPAHDRGPATAPGRWPRSPSPVPSSTGSTRPRSSTSSRCSSAAGLPASFLPGWRIPTSPTRPRCSTARSSGLTILRGSISPRRCFRPAPPSLPPLSASGRKPASSRCGSCSSR